jgi:hypothetical protein
MSNSIPEEIQAQVLEIVWATQPEWAHFLQHLENPYGNRAFSSQELERLVDGFFAVFIEAWRGGDGSLRRLFVRDTLSLLLEEGSSIDGLLYAILHAGFQLAPRVVEQLPAEYRVWVWDWLGGFFAALAEEIHGLGYETPR